MVDKKEFLGSQKCPKCGEIVAIYQIKKTITEPVKGEYQTTLELR